MTQSTPWLAEYEALSNAVGLADLTGRSRIELRGNDRVRFLHSFCTNDIQRLQPGQGCEAFLTNHQGKIVGHIFVFCDAEALVLDAVAGQSSALIAHLDRFVISDDVTFHDLTDATGELLVAGPGSRDYLNQLCGGQTPGNLWDHVETTVLGQIVKIARADFLLPASFFITCARDSSTALRQSLQRAGAAVCGAGAVEAVRLEAGTPLFGRDITEENLPQEIRRDAQAISFTKGCYLGQETVARIDAMGHVNRFLAGVRFVDPSPMVPPEGTELRSGDKVVGRVTSSTWSPRLNQPLAMALLRRATAAPGSNLESTAGRAEVVALPLT
jgi:folate-binding protein YgfZ